MDGTVACHDRYCFLTLSPINPAGGFFAVASPPVPVAVTIFTFLTEGRLQHHQDQIIPAYCVAFFFSYEPAHHVSPP
jgi:hypothetical protein